MQWLNFEIVLQHQGVTICPVKILLQHARAGNKAALRAHCWLAFALFACSLFVVKPAAADIYYFVAEDGTSHYSDQPSEPRFQLYLRTDAQPSASVPAPAPSPDRRAARRRLDGEISAAAQANRIEPALLHALIEVESGYNTLAVSAKGALGLMQLMPLTARRYGVTDPFDAAQNLRGGAHHLRDLLDLFSDNKVLALAAYNAGAGAVLAHGRRIPPYPQTSRYVPAVLQIYELLRAGTSATNH
jgi:soluble lytic murein transglycosylase-like protein